MRINLAVTQNDLSNIIGNESFWCVFKSSKINKGDFIYFYKTKVGINQIYNVTSDPYKDGEFECKYRNLLTIKIKLVLNIINPVSIQALKNNDILKNSKPVKRNFQALLFELTEEESNALRQLIVDLNPGITLQS